MRCEPPLSGAESRVIVTESAYVSAFVAPLLTGDTSMARVLKSLTITSMCALALTACAKTDEPGTAQPAGQQQGPVKIGISLPLTGDFAEPGNGIKDGYQVWA